MDRKAAAVDGTDRRTDGQTPAHYINPAAHTTHIVEC